MEIPIELIVKIILFLFVWLVSYGITVMSRFGDTLTKKSEAIAITISLIAPILILTDLIVFV